MLYINNTHTAAYPDTSWSPVRAPLSQSGHYQTIDTPTHSLTMAHRMQLSQLQAPHQSLPQIASLHIPWIFPFYLGEFQKPIEPSLRLLAYTDLQERMLRSKSANSITKLKRKLKQILVASFLGTASSCSKAPAGTRVALDESSAYWWLVPTSSASTALFQPTVNPPSSRCTYQH